MGPDLNAAKKAGNKVGKELLKQLINQHNLYDVTKTKYKTMIQLPHSRARWKQAKTDFVRAVEEIFIEDACNSF